MRILFVLAVAFAAAFAGCSAGSRPSESSSGPTTAWQEFKPGWRAGPADVWYGSNHVKIPAGESYATDGKTFFYAVGAPRDAAADQICREKHPPLTGGVWVMLDAEGCHWAPEPSIQCSRSDACAAFRA